MTCHWAFIQPDPKPFGLCYGRPTYLVSKPKRLALNVWPSAENLFIIRPMTRSVEQNWLKDALARGEREGWCMKRRCTTCGAPDMVGLLTGMTVTDLASHRVALDSFTVDRARVIADGLRSCGPGTPRDGIMWLLFMIWQILGDRSHVDVFPVLRGTHAGDVLDMMSAHHDRLRGR